MKTVSVFISSTFRDMHAERDHLVRFVFPRVREQLLPRRLHLVDLDQANAECRMRNGIEEKRRQTAGGQNQVSLVVSVGGLQIHHQPVNISP